MEKVWIQSRQHDQLKTFCRLTGRNIEDVLDEILLEWASSAAHKQMRPAMGSSPFLSGLGASRQSMTRDAGKVVSIRREASQG